MLIWSYTSGLFLNPKFNSEKWKSAKPNSEIRYEMLKHLYRTHEFIGMEKETVLKLFGEPDIKHKHSFQYLLKISESKIDTSYFSLGISNDEKVIITLISSTEK
jgi:hypothetical protein